MNLSVPFSLKYSRIIALMRRQMMEQSVMRPVAWRIGITRDSCLTVNLSVSRNGVDVCRPPVLGAYFKDDCTEVNRRARMLSLRMRGRE
jgi:hypothetical protein